MFSLDLLRSLDPRRVRYLDDVQHLRRLAP
jgi:hypothetical protein